MSSLHIAGGSTGAQNAVIHAVTDSNISLQINAETKEIPNELKALQEALSSHAVRSFQYAQTIYNIEQISEANFSFATGRMAFNELLTRELIQTLAAYSPRVSNFTAAVKSTKDWEKKPNINSRAKDIIAESFTGILGMQLRKLIAIGKQPPSDDKNYKYIEYCILTCKRALQLMCFSLISELWNTRKKDGCSISAAQRVVLNTFFENEFYQDIAGTANLLEHLYAIFATNNLVLPIHGSDVIASGIKPGNRFRDACQKLHDLNEVLEVNFSPLDCFEAETQITYILSELAFLTHYYMVSIKRIGYDEMRNKPPYFLHCYVTLGTKNTIDKFSEVFSYDKEPVCTDAVLLYKEDYKKSINLFPFVVDMNALLMEGGTRICFFDSVDPSEGSLKYVFLEDNSLDTIKFEDMTMKHNNMNDIINDLEKRRLFKLDEVILQFQEAKRCLLTE